MKLTDEELENVAGGKRTTCDPCTVYCEGITFSNGMTAQPGCDFKATFPSKEMAQVAITSEYSGRCPNCGCPLGIE